LSAILAKIHPVSRAKIDPPFDNACADRFHIARIPGFDPGNRGADFRRSTGIEGLEPSCERASPIFGFVLDNLDHIADQARGPLVLHQ